MAYYLKEQLREIWNQPSKKKAEEVLIEWIEQARASQVRPLRVMANALMAYRRGILAWYDCQISTAKVKGIDNKIKVFKRVAYGFYRSEVLQPKTLCLASLLHHAECRMNQNVLMYRIRHNSPLGSSFK